MANSVTNSFFPSQVVSDQEKVSQIMGCKLVERFKMNGLAATQV